VLSIHRQSRQSDRETAGTLSKPPAPAELAVNREAETWLCMLALAVVAVALLIAWSASQ
jgi:hypothetical protein